MSEMLYSVQDYQKIVGIKAGVRIKQKRAPKGPFT